MPWLLAILLAIIRLLSHLAGYASPAGFIHGPPQPKARLDIVASYRWIIYQVYVAVRRLTRRVRRTMVPRAGKECACCAQIQSRHRGGGNDDHVSLAQLEEAATIFRCERCGTLGKCIAKFATRWQKSSLASEDVRIDKQRLNMARVDVNEQSVLVRWPDGSVNVPSYPGFGYELLSLVILYGEPTKSGEDVAGREFCGCVPVDPESDACFEFIQQRIEHCLVHHNLCGSTIANNPNLTSFLPTRLIELNPADPDDIRLVETHKFTAHQRQSTPYIALSYCWGIEAQLVKPIPKLTQRNISERLVSISASELTQTFSDAIRTANRLGIRHVWFDALCILQDCPSDFANEASKMAMIYGTARVVISATRATTGDQGIFHARTPPHEVSYVDTRGRQATAYVKQAGLHKDFILNDPGEFCRAPVFARAWCFQERLLARRVVHFAEAEVVWECNELVACECGSMSLQETGLEGAVNFKTRQARRFVASSSSSSSYRHGHLNMDLYHRSALWSECIHTYTTRLLTYESDRLPALSGYAHELHVPAMGRYLAGIWEFQLPAALLWYITHPRLGNANSDGWAHRPEKNEAPSWSWASIQGAIVLRTGIRRKVVARVVKVECIAKTADAFGKVEQGAYIMINAPVLRVTLVGHGTTQDYWGIRPCASIKLAETVSGIRDSEAEDGDEVDLRGEDDCIFLADLDLTRPGSEDHVSIGSCLACVVIEQQGRSEDASPARCLVLKARQSADGGRYGYRRVGILDCPELWLERAKQETIKIF